MSVTVAIACFTALLALWVYGGEVLALIRWHLVAPELDAPEAARTQHDSTPARLFDRLITDLGSDDEHRRRRSEVLLANYPSPDVLPRLLPLLHRGPWDPTATAAARLLLARGDESVIEPLHAFFSSQDGGIAAFLSDMTTAAPPLPLAPPMAGRANNVIDLFSGSRRCGGVAP